MDWQELLFGSDSNPTKIEGRYDRILVDGLNLLHRSAHSYSDLGYWEGEEFIHTGATYGFIRMVLSLWGRFADAGCELVVCWDAGYDHRLALLPSYKQSRRHPQGEPEHKKVIRSQQEVLISLIEMAGWSQASAPGYEADDVLATLSRQYAEEGHRVALYTMDQDLHQCVTERVHVVSAQFGKSLEKIWGPDQVLEKWGFPPNRVAEIKGLCGDSGDDIPGCPGCGMGWAKKLLTSWDTVPDILEAAKISEVLKGTYEGKAWTAKSLTRKLRENADTVLVSWELAKVVFDAPVKVVQSTQIQASFRDQLNRLQFTSLTASKTFDKLRAIV